MSKLSEIAVQVIVWAFALVLAVVSTVTFLAFYFAPFIILAAFLAMFLRIMGAV